MSYLGFLAGAGFAWNASVAANPEAFDLAALLDVHAFRDAAGVMGSIACDLGNTYLQTGSKVANVSALFALVVFADQTLPSGQTAGITAAHLTKTLTYLDEVTQRLAEARMDRADAGLIVDELRWAKDILYFACHFGIARLEAGEGSKVSAIPQPSETCSLSSLPPSSPGTARSGFAETVPEVSTTRPPVSSRPSCSCAGPPEL